MLKYLTKVHGSQLSSSELKEALQGHINASLHTRQSLHYDGRNRLSNVWTPTQSKKSAETVPEDGHDLLVRAGFLRQAHSGIFHLLPLGLRVQEKIERLIDKHMLSLGASKVSLSSLTSEDLWQLSGRLEKGRGSEFFRLEDRKGTKLLLSPTHEEEITTIATNAVHSHKQLPLRLYQVSRKYRDEARPRQGLLRGREFVMKDLYTFDSTEQSARATYEDVRQAYCAFLDELRLPYLVASADSGNMGGNLSHEYHFASEAGEDTIIKCNQCEYSANEELYTGRPETEQSSPGSNLDAWTLMISKDRRTLLVIPCPIDRQVNIYAVKKAFPDVDASVEAPLEMWKEPEMANRAGRKICWIGASSVNGSKSEQSVKLSHALRHAGIGDSDMPLEIDQAVVDGQPIGLTKADNGDTCPSCSNGHLSLRKAVEIGHTFHLGTRYSEPLNLRITDADNRQSLVQMGCHGIGVSRLIGAAASLLADFKGLNWPAAIAPYTVVLVAAGKTSAEAVHGVYDSLQQMPGTDAIIDDRTDYPTGWKLHDADLIGYPFIVVLGKAWAERGAVELQCRRLGLDSSRSLQKGTWWFVKEVDDKASNADCSPHRSAQKQMGRPKKRRRVEGEQEEASLARRERGSGLKAWDIAGSKATEQGICVAVGDGDGGTGSSVLDDFLTPRGGLQPWVQATEWAVPSEHALPGLMPDSASNSPPTINLPAELQFGSTTHSSLSHRGSTQLLFDPYSGQDEYHSNISPITTLPTCACLSTLYLTLNTLQSMDPTSPFPFSLHPLREALRTASDVLSCPLCPTRFLSAVQNTQLAGTLLMSIAERFGKILAAITQEAERAEQGGEVKRFRLADLNTSTSHLHAGGIGCVAAFSLNLSAGEWRTMAKKVVRAEVHGPSDGNVCCPYFVGVVEQMESRQEHWLDWEIPLDFPRDTEGAPIGGENIPREDHVCIKLCAYSRKVIAGYDWS
ncbi:hypothetical protein B0A55_05090 [Friedmanniomyces simplex]|uniref:proline--tRNA ligase n=1 Tax=Friedmanniomyces simplex TaxID=329884 RepID=A0A4U0XET9_9PEZI|nr:hypothetical protein B0A55_05090 [Friedmanniomyces simplex]